MGETILTRKKREKAIFRATALCLGMDPDTPETHDCIKVSWPLDLPSGSLPGWERDDRRIFIRVVPARSMFANLHDTDYVLDESDEPVEVVTYHRPHEVSWICYGPDALDDADAIRIGIIRKNVLDVLRSYSLYPLPHIDDPIPANELVDGAWWGRADLTAQMYEWVKRVYSADIIEVPPEIKMEVDK